MHKTYPLALRLEGKNALVVGGGNVAAEKVPPLINAGAVITVVSPDLHPRLQDAANNGRLIWVKRRFEDSDIEGALIVFAATDDHAVNKHVFHLCEKEGKLANVVDDIPLCNFFVPSIAESGPIQVAVNTGGSSPALAGQLRRRIQAEILGPEVGELAEWMALWRARFKPVLGSFENKKRFWLAVLDSEIPNYLAEGQRSMAEHLLLQMLHEMFPQAQYPAVEQAS
jgi:uroporphyrin-III C-methyltransferase/precorrin-2 dehydrogenase/sirohydrochlorin ferrochelatase